MAQVAAAARAAKATHSAPTSTSATPATTQRASRVRNATAPPPPSSSSAPVKTLKDTDKRRGTATRTGSTSMAAPAAAETSDFYEARAIIGEKGSRYLIDWEGVDPATGAAYAPTWEPKRSANTALKREWEGKKAKDGAEQAKVGDAETQSQVTAGQSKVQRDNALNVTAQKGTASNRPLRAPSSRQREQRIGKEARGREVRKKNQTGRPSTQDSKHKPDATHEAQQNRLRELSGRNLKRKSNTDGAADKAKPWSATTHSQPQPNNKKQRRQPAEPPLESPSEQVFPARAITGERPRQYRVAWEKDPVTGEEYEDTWEPKSYVSRDLVAKWRRQQKASTKQQMQPAEKTHERQDEQHQEEPDDNVYSVRAIVGERKRQYLVAWEDDPRTGEKFEDTWEPKGNVSKDLVAEWRQQKDTKRPEETSQQPVETSKQPEETSKQPEETSKQPEETPKRPEETPKRPEETPKRLKEPAQKPPEESPATAVLSEMVMEVLREEEQRQHSPSLPIGPVTPRRDEDEYEEDEEEGSYTPSSTMVHTAAPVDDDITMEPHTTAD